MSSFSLFPNLKIISVGFLGLYLIYQVRSKRDRLKAKYGQLAY